MFLAYSGSHLYCTVVWVVFDYMAVWEKAHWNWTIPNSCYCSLSWTIFM